MAATKRTSKKPTLTRKSAMLAAKKAQEHFKATERKKTAAWKKGGREWSRVLGHFGSPA